MALLWKDKIDGADRIKAADINAIAHAIIDLENNAELLGDAPMVFKGVVSELPDTANEGEVYKITNTTTSNLYVRHNGEWVEIWESGVTKAEMESYIEETLLGGEW